MKTDGWHELSQENAYFKNLLDESEAENESLRNKIKDLKSAINLSNKNLKLMQINRDELYAAFKYNQKKAERLEALLEEMFSADINSSLPTSIFNSELISKISKELNLNQ